MSLGAKWLAVGVSVVVQALSGILLSIAALVLVHFVPSLTQLPPSFVHDPIDTASHSSHRRVRPRSIRTTLSSDSSSDGASEPSSPTRDFHIKDLPVSDKAHAATLLDAQSRSRATRSGARAPRALLPTLEEDPIMRPLSVGDYGFPGSFDSGTLFESPLGTPEEDLPVGEAAGVEGEGEGADVNRRHTFRLPHFKLSQAPKKHKLCRCQSLPTALNTLNNEAPRRPERGSTWADNTGHVSKWKIATMQNHKPKEKEPSRAPVERTHPYEAPYFFPSPVSPEAYDYVRRVRMDLQHADVIPARTLSPVTSAPSTSHDRSKVSFAPVRRTDTGLSS